MTKAELQNIVADLVEELREMPDGTEITSLELLKACGYAGEFEWEDLMDYHQALLRAAGENHIRLDMSKHENRLEGLPFNLDFVVRNRRAQIKCPFCGSRQTARILYGSPAFNEKLKAKMESGKVVLGGCMITSVRDQNGDTVLADPQRYCRAYRKKFARPPYLVAKDRSGAEAYSDIVTGIRFSDGGFFEGYTEIKITKTDGGAVVSVRSSRFDEGWIPDRKITSLRWKRLVDRLYSGMYVHEWKKDYDDLGVLDGEQWSLEISLTNGRKRFYRGSNAFPPYWPELNALFRPFLKERT